MELQYKTQKPTALGVRMMPTIRTNVWLNARFMVKCRYEDV